MTVHAVRSLRALVLGGIFAFLAACGGHNVSNTRAAGDAQLCQGNFQTCVQPVLQAAIRPAGGSNPIACMDSSCHVAGGNGNRLILTSDALANYEALQGSSFVNYSEPDASLLLAEPLRDSLMPSSIAGTAQFHGGGELFPSISDQCYNAIYQWIAEQVTSESACNVCTAVVNPTANCGY